MALAQQVGLALAQRNWVAVTAESCTGGGVSTAITDIAGSSAWFDRAFVTYSNEAKQEMLGVREQTLSEFGAVSEAWLLKWHLVRWPNRAGILPWQSVE